MQRSEINDYIKKNYRTMPDIELAMTCGLTVNAVQKRRKAMELRHDPLVSPKDAVEARASQQKSAQERTENKRTIDYLMGENLRLQRERDAAIRITEPFKTHTIKPSKSTGGEATMIALLSDWHLEEPVLRAQVNGLNEYNLEIAQKRAEQYFSTLLRLVQIEQQNTRVDTLVLGLIGDFITGDIHEELAEMALLSPTEATRFAQKLIVSGIDYILENSKLKIVCKAHSGNHGRTTKDQRHAMEHGHSLEWLMYHSIADRYADNPRVEIDVAESYHSYLKVYDWTIRFHHGHAINYGGGVGGITIPVRKAIAQWNTLRPADFDCFGHFHQAFDGNNFIANGSMIGYNAYALSIKAGFEEPVQMLFGIHSKLGKYITRPIKFV